MLSPFDFCVVPVEAHRPPGFNWVELVSRPTASPPLGSSIVLPSLTKARITSKNCHAREIFLLTSSALCVVSTAESHVVEKGVGRSVWVADLADAQPEAG